LHVLGERLARAEREEYDWQAGESRIAHKLGMARALRRAADSENRISARWGSENRRW